MGGILIVEQHKALGSTPGALFGAGGVALYRIEGLLSMPHHLPSGSFTRKTGTSTFRSTLRLTLPASAASSLPFA
jgi:hypothetical protein